MRTKLVFILSFLVTLGLLSSCFKNEEYPLEPIITNPTLTFTADSLKLTFDFTDGDGDIGLNPSELSAPFDEESYYYYNLYIEYFEKDDEKGWIPGLNLSGDSIVFEYRLKPIIVKGKSRGIKGTIEVFMNPFFNASSSQSDTVRYRIKLIDKALNESNELETAEIYP
jgi:hypothetical protein